MMSTSLLVWQEIIDKAHVLIKLTSFRLNKTEEKEIQMWYLTLLNENTGRGSLQTGDCNENNTTIDKMKTVLDYNK